MKTTIRTAITNFAIEINKIIRKEKF